MICLPYVLLLDEKYDGIWPKPSTPLSFPQTNHPVSECNFLDVESAEALHNNQTFSSLLPSLSASRLDIDAAVHGQLLMKMA